MPTKPDVAQGAGLAAGCLYLYYCMYTSAPEVFAAVVASAQPLDLETITRVTHAGIAWQLACLTTALTTPAVPVSILIGAMTGGAAHLLSQKGFFGGHQNNKPINEQNTPARAPSCNIM